MNTFYVSKLNEVYVQVDSPELHMLKELVDYFTFKVPGAEFMPSYKNKYWDGKIRLFNPINCKLYLGLIGQLKYFCEKNDYKIDYEISIVAYYVDIERSKINLLCMFQKKMTTYTKITQQQLYLVESLNIRV